MKKLQNNFTTPEQSKRLLELGVPANSADCYWYNYDLERLNREYRRPRVRNNHTYRFKDFFGCYGTEYLPCWSATRLIEIYETCTACLFERRNPQLSVLEDVLSQIAEDIMATDECWDFSKLMDND